MPDLRLVPKPELDRLRMADVDRDEARAAGGRLPANALVAVKRAGSGHLGSTFSALDVVAHLLFEELNVAELGFDDPDRDVFFSSKGHDVPGLYAALFALGVVPRERLLRLRRLGGLDGHPDVGVPGIEASSGSLGMGISKGRGIALAKRRLGHGGRVVVMTGDGELQEGQNWEALQAAAHERLGGLWVVVDRNEVQSDKPTEEIVALGDLEGKLRAFGWHAETVDGHDHAALRAAFAAFVTGTTRRRRSSRGRSRARASRSWSIRSRSRRVTGPTAGTRARPATSRSHRRSPSSRHASPSGAPRSASTRPRSTPSSPRRPCAVSRASPSRERARARGRAATREYVVEAYGETLLELAAERDDLVVLDADLASDCRIRAFELAYPDRFFQCGIAEQDMVSTAAGMARHGLLPVVNSFASFLASRANEQIYNQASEGSKVVYALHYAGLVPAGPGKSHQSLRDISLLAALPNVAIVQPGSREETGALLRWAVEEAEESVAVRLAIGPSPRRIELPALGGVGRGTVLREGSDAVLISYGPVMLHEALLAAERLAESGELSLRVVAMPWLNRFDADWLAAESPPSSTSSCSKITRRWAVSATGFAALSRAAPSRCSASRAGPHAGRPTRRSASTLWTARRSPTRIAARVGVPAR